jgi:hypothetical protein
VFYQRGPISLPNSAFAEPRGSATLHLQQFSDLSVYTKKTTLAGINNSSATSPSFSAVFGTFSAP